MSGSMRAACELDLVKDIGREDAPQISDSERYFFS
jgi:hypothetical protein